MLSILALLPLLVSLTCSDTWNRIPADSIRFVNGRVNDSDPDRVLFDWPGVEVWASFTGTAVGIELTDASSQYNIFIDGESSSRAVLKVNPGRRFYTAASGLSNALHFVRITKRTEPVWGTAALHGVYTTGTPGPLPDAPVTQHKVPAFLPVDAAFEVYCVKEEKSLLISQAHLISDLVYPFLPLSSPLALPFLCIHSVPLSPSSWSSSGRPSLRATATWASRPAASHPTRKTTTSRGGEGSGLHSLDLTLVPPPSFSPSVRPCLPVLQAPFPPPSVILLHILSMPLPDKHAMPCRLMPPYAVRAPHVL